MTDLFCVFLSNYRYRKTRLPQNSLRFVGHVDGVIFFFNLFSAAVSLCHSKAQERRIVPCKGVDSGLLGFGIRNTAHGIRNPTEDSNPESKFYRQILEFSTWNPESKTVLDSLTWGETYKKLAGI